MSSAMEKMVASMLGFTPEQMHETLDGFRQTITTLADDLAVIKTNGEKALANQAVIIAKLERLENVGSIGNDGDSSGNAGRRGGNRRGGQRDGTSVAVVGSDTGSDNGNG